MIGLSTLVIVGVTTPRLRPSTCARCSSYIEEGIASKGKVLTENHALALRGLTLDNAFLDMQRLVERAIKDDSDLVYGVYVSSDAKRWHWHAARQPQWRRRSATAGKSLGFDEQEVPRQGRTHRAEAPARVKICSR